MPTEYNIQFTAEHPLKMDADIPHPMDALRTVETVLRQLGLRPVSGQVRRSDDESFDIDGHDTQYPPHTLLGAAGRFVERWARKVNPESDIYDEEFAKSTFSGMDIITIAEELAEEARL